ncbi:MAG: DNA repair protein RadA [Candidatus Eisenbacteria bacterium]|nr:DNA repair protein RadA [Candidatus Eisenbacteria bacterium]
MKKQARRTAFVCTRCGHDDAKWFGQCPSCREYNTVSEIPVDDGAARPRRAGARVASGAVHRPVRLADVASQAEPRAACGIAEVDRVLGGGIVPGSLLLIGGDPGIGKSTLLLQVADALSRAGRSVLYVSGEESSEQIRMRADRMGVDPGGIWLLAETDLDSVESAMEELRPEFAVMDSIQTVYAPDISAAPGSVVQLRECGLRLLRRAKDTGCAVVLIGHVTKEGEVAGPRVLEHLVDAVLYLEGERSQALRILRGVKNRFGSTQEIGLFEMRARGLAELNDPARAFLVDVNTAHPGSAVVAPMQGTRPVLVEVQALTARSSFAMPQRVASGFDARRLAVLLAVLERRAGVGIPGSDLFLSTAGGFSLDDPGADLGVALAVASSARDVALPPRTLALGEVGLSGDLRRCLDPERRIREAARLGFERAIVPQASSGDLPSPSPLKVIAVGTLREALERSGILMGREG